MQPDYWILFWLYIAANLIRSAYEWAQTRDIVSPRNRPLFMAMFANMIILWTCWFAMGKADPYPLPLPLWLRASGVTLTVLGLVLAIGALIQLRGVINIDHLVRTGLFARLRHPMYFGFALWIVGWALYCGAGVSFLAGLFGFGHILYWRRVEEDFLLETFGDAYREYREQSWF